LTERGERNATRLGERLKGLTVDKVFCSPLQRVDNGTLQRYINELSVTGLKVVAAAHRGGREKVGCIILGRGEDDKKVREWLSTAAAGHHRLRRGLDRLLGAARPVAGQGDDA
jgi:broad specificity phosphatase PhoE